MIFLKSFLLRLHAVILLIISVNLTAEAQMGGYVDRVSVTQGDSVSIYISTSVSPDTINVFKIGSTARFITAFNGVQTKVQTVRDSSYMYGCGWQPTLKFLVPDSWAPGVYRAEFKVTQDSSRGVLFIVKPREPSSDILYVLSTNTWQAYNDYGGKSLYANFSSDGIRSHKVSMLRPAALPYGSFGSADFYKYAYKFLTWAGANNINMDFASKYDLDTNPNLLEKYKVVFLVGHNEYWSWQERDQTEKFIESGGKLIILSGNTCWWQVRFEDNGNTMVCYKDRTLDPLTGKADSLVTVNWWSPPVNYPENKFTGVNFKDGGYVNSGNKLPHSSGYGDYAAFNTQYWVFNGTGLKDGDQFGYDKAVVGYETDGTGFYYKNGIPTVTGQELTPSNFRIFGVSPTVNYDTSSEGYGHATMGMFYEPGGGAVFNAATTDWADGLYTLPSAGIYPDTIINKITMNVLNRFLKNSFPPEIISWSPFNLKNERINRDPVVINKREAMVPPEDSIKLSFLAKDPFNKHVSFFWTADGMQAAGTDSVFVFKNNNTSTVPTKYIVTGFAYNSNDTAKISWDIFNSPLVINSQPVTKVNPGRNYSYSIEAYNYYSDSLSYLLQGPAWLKNNGNEISGTAPQDTGRYEIKVQVSNTHGQFDEQSFTIHVTANITGIQPATPPQSFALEQNYPNPFNPGTVISYKLGVSGRVTLKIFDILGNEVSTLVDKWQSSGIHKVDFKASKTTSGRQLSSGIYFYRLNAGGFVQVKKMMLLK